MCAAPWERGVRNPWGLCGDARGGDTCAPVAPGRRCCIQEHDLDPTAEQTLHDHLRQRFVVEEPPTPMPDSAAEAMQPTTPGPATTRAAASAPAGRAGDGADGTGDWRDAAGAEEVLEMRPSPGRETRLTATAEIAAEVAEMLGDQSGREEDD